MPKIHIATSREIGQKCIEWVESQGVKLVGMEECDIFISILYDKLVTEEFIKSKQACYNFHPGYLPDYRGAGAYSWVIINGESSTGVTLHMIDKDIDHGVILDRKVFPIREDDTAESLFHQAEKVIFEMFKGWWTRRNNGEAENIQPNIGGHIYLRKDLEKAKDLTRFVRAFTFGGKEDAYYYNYKGEKRYLPYFE